MPYEVERKVKQEIELLLEKPQFVLIEKSLVSGVTFGVVKILYVRSPNAPKYVKHYRIVYRLMKQDENGTWRMIEKERVYAKGMAAYKRIKKLITMEGENNG